LARYHKAPLAIIAPKILSLDEPAGEDLNRIDKIDAVLEDIR
jgi:hypothetical protein